MESRKILAVGLIVYVIVLFCVIRQPVIHATAIGNGSLTLITAPVPSSDDEPPSRSIFESSLFIAILWPVAFVILEVTLSALATTSQLRADGSRKYRVWHKDADGRKIETSPVDIEWLKTEFNDPASDIRDIEVLAPGVLESFRFGVDLCISALATDLAIIFAILSIGFSSAAGSLMSTTVSVLMLHFIVAVMAAFVLRSWSTSESSWARVCAVQFANILGVGAIFVSFLILGDLITR